MEISKAPINLWSMNVDKFVKDNFIGEVKSLLIFEPSSTQFHPEGLYSEIIFGQVGSPDRVAKLGYINLHTDILEPLIYQNTIDVVSWYENILKGTQYAVFDPDAKKFIQADKDTELAETGFLFFMKYFNQLEFERNKSITRTDKIRVIEEAIRKNTYKTNKMLVCPAGWRDVRTDSNGRTEVDKDLHPLYSSLLALSNEISIPISSPAIIAFFNNIRLSIQLKVNQIFQYFEDFAKGKSGFNQEKYAKRYVAWGTRNVITTPSLIAESPDSVDYLKYNETLQPLFQLAIAFMPLVIHHLNALFISQIYSFGAIQVPAIDKKTLQVKYIEVSPADVTEALSSDGKAKFVQSFKNLEMRQDPVTVKDVHGEEYYLWLVYDLGDSIYMFRNLEDLEKLLNEDNVIDGDTSIKIEDCPELTPENTMPRWYNILRKYKEYLDIDLSYLYLKFSKIPYFRDGKENKEMNRNMFGACITNLGFIAINPNVRLTFKYYNNNENYTTTLNKFWNKVDALLAHELAHEIFDKYKDTEKIQNVIKELESNKEFDTEYSITYKNGDPDKYFQERFCEYLGMKITNSKLPGYTIDRNKIHPLTNVEMLYIATYEAVNKRYTTVCRYPCIEMGSTFPTKPVVGSTSPSRVVKFKSQYNPIIEVTYPHYPIYGSNTYLDSMVVHPCKTAGLNADHDGDTASSNGIYTNEAIEECRAHLSSLKYFISPDGKFYDTVATNSARLALHALTYANDSELSKIIPE